MEIKRSAAIAVIILGITSIASQIVALRELIVVFYGNELSIGFILSSWLLFGAIGSLASGALRDQERWRAPLFCACQLFLSAGLPLSILLIRYIKTGLGYMPGEIVPIGIIAITVPFAIGPICMALGFMFGIACKRYPSSGTVSGIGRVYILESAGAAIGGLLISLFLISRLSPLNIMVGLSLLNIIGALSLSGSIDALKARRALLFTSAVSLAIFASILLFDISGKVERFSREFVWRPFDLITSQNSIYGNISVARKGGQISFFSNGVHDFSVPDKLSQEEGIHYAFLQHKDPKDILLIGGGAGGLLWEALKYPLDTLDYVELDPLVIKLSREFLSGSPYYALDDPKVNIINADGRYFIKKTLKRYDIVAVNIPDPYTASINRFYTKEFFLRIGDILKEDGVLSFSVTSSENYINAELGEFLGSIHRTLSEAFDHITLIPGDTAYFLASRDPGTLSKGYATISERLNTRKIETGFVNRGYLFSKLSDDRIEYMSDSIKKAKRKDINEDFRPVSYFYDIILWSKHFRGILPRVLKWFTPISIWAVVVFISMSILAWGFAEKKRGAGPSSMVLTAICATGFSEMAFEIMVMLSFQIIYGFLYYKIGLILTSFMIGLLSGSFYITNRIDRIKDRLDSLIKVQAAVVIYPLLLPFIFSALSGSKTTASFWIGSNIVFPLLPFVAGFIGGLQFPIGAGICVARFGEGKAGGVAYATDLAGACVGATLVSAIFVPIIGVFGTCVAIGLLNFSIYLALLMNRRAA